VAIYLRVSTLEQAEKGWSIEGQNKEIRDYCDREAYKVVRIYKDLGCSGANIERPSLQKMLEHSCQRQFDKLIIWKYDRLSRNNMDFPALIHFLNKNNVEVVSVKEPTPNDGSPYNEFVIGLLGLISQLERRVFVMRSVMGRKVKAKKGFWKGGEPAYGFSYNKETGYLEINPEEAKIVKFIFSRYVETRNFHEVARNLNDMKVKPRRAKKWADQTIKCFIQNRLYIGEYLTMGYLHHFDEYRIIGDEIFFRAQKSIGSLGHIPYGYEWDYSKGHMIPKTTEIEVVKKMFQIFLEKRTISGVRNYLILNEILTKYQRKRRWFEGVVIGILTNPVYIGYSCGRGNKYEPVFDEKLKVMDTDTFLEVQLIGEAKYKSFRHKLPT